MAPWAVQQQLGVLSGASPHCLPCCLLCSATTQVARAGPHECGGPGGGLCWAQALCVQAHAHMAKCMMLAPHEPTWHHLRATRCCPTKDQPMGPHSAPQQTLLGRGTRAFTKSVIANGVACTTMVPLWQQPNF